MDAERCKPRTTGGLGWLLVSGLALVAIGSAVQAAEPGSAVPTAEPATRRPNVVVFLADDQGWGDLSIHGNQNLATPHIDSLARDGALLERFFVCPVCAPTRAEFFTGRYHPRGGVRGVSTGEERLNLDEQTIAQLFADAGYATAAFGKWHNGTQAPYHPNFRGFQEYYGFTSGHWGHYFSPELDHNQTFVRGHGYLTDDFTDHALDFIAAHAQQPFFCYLPYCTPHSPMQVPDEYWAKHANNPLPMRHHGKEGQEDLTVTRAALAMVENIDANVGRVLRKLSDLKLDENTIVVYFSDNGPNSWRWNDGMKGRKGSVDEGGLRVPFLIRWPGRIPAGRRVPQIAGAIDLLPTLGELCQVPLTVKKPLDGKSIAPLLRAEAGEWPDRMLFAFRNQQVSVRTQQYRLDPAGKLYDMTTDSGQQRDIAAAQPAVAGRLRAAAQQIRQEVAAELAPSIDRPFTVGYAPFTPLPARDGVAHGQIKRSNTAPNCSYFTHWISTADTMTWDIEVGQAGRYEAAVHYTAADDAVGSILELSLAEAKVAGPVAKAHDPPAYGQEADRASRGSESYVKDFAPLVLGTLELPAIRGVLTLRATKQTGARLPEIRYVTLRRL